jgi:Cof subfamily protein (haloacid dehalogenase superfamily)
MYRLIAIDLDGTLLGRDHALNSRTRAALDGVAAQGAQIVIATGRPFAIVRLLCPGLSLSAPQICYNGAVIHDPVTDRALHRSLLPRQHVRPVLDFLMRADIPTVVCGPERVCLDRRISTPDDWAPSPLPAPAYLSDMSEVRDSAAIKVVGQAEPEIISGIWPEALHLFGDSLYVTRTADHLVEFLHPASSKGAALRRIAAMLGVGQEGIVAFGDQHNDLTMFAEAGLAVAMGNATGEVKAAAHRVTGHNSDDGVAAILEELFNIEPTRGSDSAPLLI